MSLHDVNKMENERNSTIDLNITVDLGAKNRKDNCSLYFKWVLNIMVWLFGQ
jgi:hypothetical protein